MKMHNTYKHMRIEFPFPDRKVAKLDIRLEYLRAILWAVENLPGQYVLAYDPGVLHQELQVQMGEIVLVDTHVSDDYIASKPLSAGAIQYMRTRSTKKLPPMTEQEFWAYVGKQSALRNAGGQRVLVNVAYAAPDGVPPTRTRS
jgi:hypothetical protein